VKHGFIRLAWGDCSSNGLRGGKLYKDICRSIEKEKFPFVIYVLGTENYKYFTKLGFSCVLVNDSPLIFDVETQQWAHKLYLLSCAMHDYDEMVYLDWDCEPVKPIDNNIWDILNKKESFQANLFFYRTKRCLWRENERRKTCNGGFLYIRDKTIPSKFIANYNELLEWTIKQKAKRQSVGKDLRLREKCLIYDDEPAMSKYVDSCMGGWQGVDYYWDHFEPDVCNLNKHSVYDEEKLNTKENVYFRHVL